MTAEPPVFTLVQLDKLLAERCAEDVTWLAKWSDRELEAVLSRCDPRLNKVAYELMRDVAAYRDELERAEAQRRALAGHWFGCPHYPLPRSVAQITERLRVRILAGDLRPGDVVQVRELATVCYVAARAVRRATDRLCAEGLLARAGTYHDPRLVVLAQAAEEPQAV